MEQRFAYIIKVFVMLNFKIQCYLNLLLIICVLLFMDVVILVYNLAELKSRQ